MSSRRWGSSYIEYKTQTQRKNRYIGQNCETIIMVNLLKEWEKKSSWTANLPMCPIYESIKTSERDISLANLIRNEPELTLNKDLGFTNFKYVPYEVYIPKNKKEFIYPLDKSIYGIDEAVTLLTNAIYDYFHKYWDPNVKHIVFSSAGLDSRIISWVLSHMKNDYDLGDFKFLCHEPEGDIFKKIMKEQGWDESQYIISKQWDLGLFDDTNAYHRPAVNFWSDYIKDEKNITLVTGMCGGEIFSYPMVRKKYRELTENRYEDLRVHTEGTQVNFCRGYNKWGDILAPFTSYDFLQHAFRLHPDLFKMVTNEHGQKRDMIRTLLIKQFGDTTPVYVGHKYDFAISESRYKYMKDKWYSSKFYEDFKSELFVKEAKPWEVYRRNYTREIVKSVELKLYGLATTYEEAMK